MVTMILPHEYTRVNVRVGCIDVNALQSTEKCFLMRLEGTLYPWTALVEYRDGLPICQCKIYFSYEVASEPAFYQCIAHATWVYSTGMRTTIEDHDLGQYQPGMES